MLIIYKKDGKVWMAQNIRFNMRQGGIWTIELKIVPNFISDIQGELIIRFFEDEKKALEQYEELMGFLKVAKEECFGIGEDYTIKETRYKDGRTVTGDLGIPLIIKDKDIKPASLWELTCPHCQRKDHTAIHFAHTTINDLKANLACHCHACKKPFSAIFVRAMTSTVPIPKCYNMKISDCTGCPYLIDGKHACEPNTTAGANIIEEI